MSRMPPRLRIYLCCVMAAGAVALGFALLVQPPSLDGRSALLATLLVCLGALAFLTPVRLAPKRRVVFDTSLQVVALLAFPPGFAALLSALGVALGNTYLKRPWFNIAFNAAHVALSVVIAGGVYRLLAPVSLAEPGHGVAGVLAIIPTGVLLYAVQSLAVDSASAIQQRRSPFAGWSRVRLPALPSHAALVTIGAALAPVAVNAPWLLPVAVVPVAAMRLMAAAGVRFDAELVSLTEAIADAIDAARPAGAGYSRRVADLAYAVARAEGLSEEESQDIRLAARLHDVQDVLGAQRHREAPAPAAVYELYPARHDWEQAAGYVDRVLHLHGAAEILRHSQERFDGRGFPRGLAGPNIPRESRVLAACEAWVGLTSPRGNRPALSQAQAIVVLHAGAGVQWDPAVVRTLIATVQAAPAPAALDAAPAAMRLARGGA